MQYCHGVCSHPATSTDKSDSMGGHAGLHTVVWRLAGYSFLCGCLQASLFPFHAPWGEAGVPHAVLEVEGHPCLPPYLPHGLHVVPCSADTVSHRGRHDTGETNIKVQPILTSAEPDHFCVGKLQVCL